MTPEERLIGQTGLHYGEHLWLWNADIADFDHYTVAEFDPGDWYENDDATIAPVAPVIRLHADGDPRWPLTLDLSDFEHRGWYTLCGWRGCNCLAHSLNVGRFGYTRTTDGRLLCSDHSDEARGIMYEGAS